MTSHTDDDLIAAYRAGDESAATELVRRHADPVARYLFARGASASDVDDLVQEAFFRAFKALDSWRGDASFRGWLFRIAGNYQKDDFRRRRGRQIVSIADHDVVDAADPAGDLDADELARRLRVEVDRLPRLQREVFLLRSQQGLDYDEICEVLDTTPGAARVHYHHAVKRLRGLVE